MNAQVVVQLPVRSQPPWPHKSMEEYLFHIRATIFLHVLTIKDLCFFEIGIICLHRLFYLLIRKQCRYIAFICWGCLFYSLKTSNKSFTCIKQNQGLSSDLNWHLLMSYLIKCTTLYKRGFPWLMFSTKVTFDRFLKLIQSTDMVDPTIKKL